MRGIFFIILFSLATSAFSQIVLMPSNISVSYAGDIVTNPGAKISFHYTLKHWRKVTKDGRGLAKLKTKNYSLNFSLGFFNHERYQTALYFLPEFGMNSANKKGWFCGTGAGLGYMRTIINNTYEVDDKGNVNEVTAGHNYGMASVFFTFGKDMYIAKQKPWKWFVKPQFAIVFPAYPNVTGYFLFEAGVAYRFRT